MKPLNNRHLTSRRGILAAAVVLALLVAGVMMALAARDSAGLHGTVQVPRAVTTLVLHPTSVFQRRIVGEPAWNGECRAIGQIDRQALEAPCLLDTYLEMKEKAPVVGGWRVGYASLELCLSRPTLRPAKTGCLDWIQHCFTQARLPQLPGTDCSLLWYAKVATVYQYNGKRVKRAWVDCSLSGSIRVTVHVRWCGSMHGLPPFGLSDLSVGENVWVVAKNIIETTHLGRMEISPTGRVGYYGT